MADRAFAVLEDLIVFQDLPPGSMISEATLMERTGFGRTPIREALQRLALEHMVEIHPYRGSFVVPISAEAQLKALEVRRSVEELAVGLAAERATDPQRASMRNLIEALNDFDSGDARAFGIHLTDAHQSVAAAAHNEFLASVMASLHGPSRRFWFASMKDKARELRTAATLHGGILTAICQGDAAAAREASLQLNRYLVDFTYATLAPSSQRP
ncbi:GntR family transcriptional regulator [Stackebrandtia endophytica]|uniref:GntR family transcriptional regulator n=1 Tax=Stackebrandtia endophytica TaxID=1496996 RepID=A0A543AS98_9ACTN|nr:GntR family transcriptional regulator [Stackebrandtia endophytica]TQL75450.1 GntR family transcriptional regulator [Stackebrandtia endophytica]